MMRRAVDREPPEDARRKHLYRGAVFFACLFVYVLGVM